MLKIIFIRHGKTYGNTLGRYIGGRTDEFLCEEGIRLLKKNTYPKAEAVYISPMKRCVETASCIYPQEEPIENALLKECDFGIFENKNYKELAQNPEYQAWIDSNGTLPFPEGESHDEFQKRCCRGFQQCVENAFTKGLKQAAIIAHGGTIMSVLSQFASPKGEYFGWQIQNGEYYDLVLEKKLWDAEQRIASVRKGTFKND